MSDPISILKRRVRKVLYEIETIAGIVEQVESNGRLNRKGKGFPGCYHCDGKGHVARDCRTPACRECHEFNHDYAECVRRGQEIRKLKRIVSTTSEKLSEAETASSSGMSANGDQSDSSNLSIFSCDASDLNGCSKVESDHLMNETATRAVEHEPLGEAVQTD